MGNNNYRDGFERGYAKGYKEGYDDEKNNIWRNEEEYQKCLLKIKEQLHRIEQILADL